MKTKTFIFTILTIFAIFSSCYNKKLDEKKQLIIGTWKGYGKEFTPDSLIIQFMEDGTAYLSYFNFEDTCYIDPPCLCNYSMSFRKNKSRYNLYGDYYFLKIIRQELICASCESIYSDVPDTSIYNIIDINDSIMKIELIKKGPLTEDDMFYCEIPGVWAGGRYLATLYRIN